MSRDLWRRDGGAKMKDKKQVLLDSLSEEPEMVIATAYLYAKNYVNYGIDVTNAWNTAIQQNAALERANVNGYIQGVENTAREFKSELDQQNSILDKIRAEIIKYEGDCRLSVDEYPSCKQCTDNVFKTIYGILDRYKSEREEQE
jgi:hypothetical protein